MAANLKDVRSKLTKPSPAKIAAVSVAVAVDVVPATTATLAADAIAGS